MPDEETKKKIDEEYKESVRQERLKSEAAGDSNPAETLKPSFALLASSLVSQALMGLGVVKNTITQKNEVNLEEAKFAIDMLQVLQDKTKGNLTQEEKQYIDSVLYDLRIRFIDTTN